jgi:hypothetical protein
MKTKDSLIEAIKFTSQGDYACSWCGYAIPTRRDVLQEWSSAKVAGMFCTQSHAAAATNNINYVEKWGY